MKKQRNPITWVPTLYFAMGLPFVVLNMVSSLMFKGLGGVSDGQIALWTSLIMWPWTLKCLWSPFLELYRTKKFFVVCTQILTGAMFCVLAFSLGLPHYFAIAIAVMAVIAFSGATHDIVADGTYMTELDQQQQSQWIGWQGAFYNIAKIVASGGLVYLAGWLIKYYGGVPGATAATQHAATVRSWMLVFALLALIMTSIGLYHIFFLPKGAKKGEQKKAGDVWQELLDVISDFFHKKHIVYYIFFIILYRFAEGFVMKIVPLFLKASRAAGGLGLDEKQIGTLYGTFGAAAFVIGSILAGYFISWLGLKKALFPLCCVFNLPFVAYTLLSAYQPTNTWLIGSGIVIEYFGYGFGFVGLTLFMMQQIAPGKYQMAHYAFASAIMNLGVMLPGMVSGFVSDWLGYKDFFAFVLIATIPAFLITWFVPFAHADVNKQVDEASDAETV